MRNTISCVIRTYNESRHLGKLIEVLRSQQSDCEHPEIIVVDSGSTDSTVEIAESHKVKLIKMPKSEFNYSKSLNLGIESSTGGLIVILSAHSIPCNNDWLQRMCAHFENERIAAVYCRQVPWPGADPAEVFRIKNTFGTQSKIFSRDTINENMRFSNAASCIRQSLWKKHPFTIMPAAEDREWAQWAIKNGYQVIYDAEAPVYHSHNESCRKSAQRIVEIEKAADIRLLRKRNLLLTIKQAMGRFIRHLVVVYSSEHFKGSRAHHSVKCLLTSFWYLVDFHRND